MQQFLERVISGNLMVSGVPVEDVQALPDGSHIYTLSDFLFHHKLLINDAVLKLSSSASTTEDHNSGKCHLSICSLVSSIKRDRFSVALYATEERSPELWSNRTC